MSKSVIGAALVLILLLLAAVVLNYSHVPSFLIHGDRDPVLDYVKDSVVVARVVYDDFLYSERTNGIITSKLPAGSKVEVLMDYSETKYLVRVGSGAEGWADGDCLEFPDDTQADKSRMTKEQLEAYVNKSEYESRTKHLILTDIGRQLTHVFEGERGGFKLVKTFSCSTGKNKSPTVRGEFSIVNRGDWFYSQRLGSGAKYWLRFNDSYLFHSVPMDQNREIIEAERTIGERRSNGCVRLEVEDAEWLYKNVSDGSAVIIK